MNISVLTARESLFHSGSQEAFVANDSPKVKLYSLWFLFICSFSKKCSLVERSYIGLGLTHTSVWSLFLPVTFFICRVQMGRSAAQWASGLNGRGCTVPVSGLYAAYSQWWSTSYHFALSFLLPPPKVGQCDQGWLRPKCRILFQEQITRFT